MKFNDTEITQETIQRTRQHFADIAQGCINEAISGEVKVNNLQSYIEWQHGSIEYALSGKNDFTFTFMQRAYWLQTGEMVALLS